MINFVRLNLSVVVIKAAKDVHMHVKSVKTK